MEGLAVRLTGQFGVHIAQVFMGGGVTGVGANGHFQRHPRFLELALAGVQHGQVVVRLRQFRVVFCQFDECLSGFAGFTRLSQDHTFEKTHLWIARLAVQILIRLAQRFSGLARFQQPVDLAVVVGMHC